MNGYRARHITVSTCGIIPKIKEFANENIQVNLAISLHAPNDELRSSIMKINEVYKINDLINTIKEYITKTNRRVTIEYVMLNNVNDGIKEAEELTELLKGMNVYVNLIPYNENNSINYKKSNPDRINAFYDYLKKAGIDVTIRKEFGGNIDALVVNFEQKRWKMKSFYITDPGRVRTHNEDSVHYFKNKSDESNDCRRWYGWSSCRRSCFFNGS